MGQVSKDEEDEKTGIKETVLTFLTIWAIFFTIVLMLKILGWVFDTNILSSL